MRQPRRSCRGFARWPSWWRPKSSKPNCVGTFARITSKRFGERRSGFWSASRPDPMRGRSWKAGAGMQIGSTASCSSRMCGNRTCLWKMKRSSKKTWRSPVRSTRASKFWKADATRQALSLHLLGKSALHKSLSDTARGQVSGTGCEETPLSASSISPKESTSACSRRGRLHEEPAGVAPRPLESISELRRGGRQDISNARRSAGTEEERYRYRHRLLRAARPKRYHRKDGRPGDHSASKDRISWCRLRGDGYRSDPAQSTADLRRR